VTIPVREPAEAGLKVTDTPQRSPLFFKGAVHVFPCAKSPDTVTLEIESATFPSLVRVTV
jgi:hypothetical protein